MTVTATAPTKPETSFDIIHVSNETEYFHAIEDAGDKLIVVDIFASWCPPCRQIAPVFEALARQHHKTTVFIKIDIDAWPGIKRHLSVWAMPTFYFLKASRRGGGDGGNDSSKNCQHDFCQQEHHRSKTIAGQSPPNFDVVGSFMGANETLLRRGIANDGKIGMCSSMCTIQ